jgi:hypothetical protein
MVTGAALAFSAFMTLSEAAFERIGLQHNSSTGHPRTGLRPMITRGNMKFHKSLNVILILLLGCVCVSGQKTEITISFSEQFFDALLDAVFQHAPPPEFSLASNYPVRAESATRNSFAASAECNESIKILRQSNGVRTGVRFRQGQIRAPIVFSGHYNPPFVGCVPFNGSADAVIDLEFDQSNQRLIARARVQDVSLNGTGGLGSALVARMVQGTIDKKINPIEIVRTDKVTFLVPVKNASIRMKAVGFSHEVVAGQLNIRVVYEFERGN